MGGDCRNPLREATADHVRLKIQTLLQMAVVRTYGASPLVIKVGRPRDSTPSLTPPTWRRDGVTLPSYRGDAVNLPEFTRGARV